MLRRVGTAATQASCPMAPRLQGWPEPERFDPDRMGPERKEDILHAKNFLTFGYGAHYCVGEPPWQLGLLCREEGPPQAGP